MPRTAGRNLALSLPRRLICDVLHFARQIPSVPVERRMRLGELSRARLQSPQRIGWCTLFLKAYALVAASRPELRRAYLRYPWPHLYEHPENVASVAVGRRYMDEDAVFFGRIKHPEGLLLTELDARLRFFRDAAVEQVPSFRQALRTTRLPWPLRRAAWWLAFNAWGLKRAQFMGTFGVSVYGSLGASSLHPLSPLTTTLNYGEINRRGVVNVRLIYDHRVLDGATVARVLCELEEALRGTMVRELASISPLASAA
jgi:hypothetical protein